MACSQRNIYKLAPAHYCIRGVSLTRDAMEVHDYIEDKEKRLARRTQRLRDARVFDFNFVPPEPLLREEMKPVIDALLRYQHTGIANHLLIIGSRGSGKTLGVRFLESLFRARGLAILYANCRMQNTSYKLLAGLTGARARGVSFEELAERFTQKYPQKTVVVLDEVDLLSEKDVQKNILYFLSRAPNGYMTILLSNSPRWSGALDESVQSTLQPEIIHFRSYTPAELDRILTDRAKLGLGHVHKPEVLKIAALSAKYAQSDVRVAIKCLYYGATEPDAGVDANFERARRDVVLDVVRHLSDKNLLILRAVSDGEKPVKEAYSTYRRLCAQHREEPFSYVYFFSALAYLQSLGLVLLASTKLLRTYAKTVQCTFTTDVLDQVCRHRFG